MEQLLDLDDPDLLKKLKAPEPEVEERVELQDNYKPLNLPQSNDCISLAWALQWYLRDTKGFYIHYFRSFRLWLHWMGTVDPYTSKFPPSPNGMGSYEVQQLAQILKAPYDQVWWTLFNLQSGKPSADTPAN